MSDMIFPGTATPAQVLSGQTFSAGTNYGAAGTMPNNGALGTITPGTAAHAIPAGYTSGGTVAGDPNLIAQNIVTGVSVFGVAGMANISQYATGTVTSTPSGTTKVFQEMQANGTVSNTTAIPYITVSGLSFKPRVVIVITTKSGAVGSVLVYTADGAFNEPTSSGKAQLFASGTSNGDSLSNTSYNFNVDGTACYVNASGFCFPDILYYGEPLTWYAYA